MTPSRAEFIEGRIDGERATLFVRATRPTSQAQGDAAPVVINEVEMRQHEGRWYLDNKRLHGVTVPADAELDPPP